ncbi:MAG: amidase [Gemmatimonadales bacterium]|nr:amidase [Gemmatimonadales bacterium]
MKRRDFVQAAAAGAAITGFRFEPGSVDLFEFENATVLDLQKAMQDGRTTARALTAGYLGRIDAMDRRGPNLHAVIELNPDALSIAEAVDGERRARGPRGPLHGIPVLIKDNIATADRMSTTAGSLALEGSIAPADAFIVGRLRAAGAVILGKTNLSEWANFRSTHSTSGWSGRGGQCRNAYALDRTPSGSSSGSATAVAADFCAIAVGTETDGSIISPASAQSLVGIKPTLGLVSRTGIIPIAHSQDTAGPMTRTVADAAALLTVLAGGDPQDAPTVGIAATNARRGAPDYTRFLDPDGLRGARLGVARKRFFGFDRRTDALTKTAIAAMKAAGAVIVDPADIATTGQYDDGEFEVLLYEFKADLTAYLAGLGAAAPVKSLADVIAFNERNGDRELRYFGQEIMLMAEKKGPLTSPAYRKALARNRRLAGPEGIDATLKRHRLDAIVVPTSAPPGFIDLVTGDHGAGGPSTTAPAVAGYPHITVPAGYSFGLPVGVSFIGTAWSEPTLIRVAHAFEQATKLRRPPRFLPSAEA